MPRTNEYGLASAVDQSDESRWTPLDESRWTPLESGDGPRWTVLSTAPDSLKHAPDLPRIGSSRWTSDLNFRTSRISKTLNLNYTVPQFSCFTSPMNQFLNFPGSLSDPRGWEPVGLGWYWSRLVLGWLVLRSFCG